MKALREIGSGVYSHAMKRPNSALFAAVILSGALATTESSRADEKLAGIACRSVHLSYPAPEGLVFYNEVTVERSAEGTYFCVCGFAQGYYGLQELGDGKKLLIFSVWDPGEQNDPKKVDDEKRVKLLYQDKDVRVGRFGGEGTGGQSFFDYDWSIGKTYRFLVTAKPNGDRTEYTASFLLPESSSWKRLVTFSTISGGKPLKGYYSFIEDFKRDRVSATKVREAHFGNGWVRSVDGQWHALTRAQFTGDSNPATNIDAAANGERFFLATGGETKNAGAPLKGFLNREPTGLVLPKD